MHRNLRSLLTFLFGWPLSLIALFFLTKTFYSQLTNIKSDLAHLNVSILLVSILLFAFYFFLRGYIWYKLLRLSNFNLDVRESLFHWSFAQLKRYIPGNIWGVVSVSLHFEKKQVSKKAVASAFITETQLVILSSLFVSILGAPLLLKVLGLSRFEDVIIIGGGILLLLGTLIYGFSHSLRERLKLNQRVFNFLFPSLPFNSLLKLWSLMAISFVVYGLGTYFAITSISFLDPTMLAILVGYFVLSLTAGFLSIITPSGLGVREGVIVFGLTQFIPASIAAFAALFARLILILGEVIFVGISYIIHQARRGVINKIALFVEQFPNETLLASFYLVFVSYFSWISFLRYENYYTGRFDLGNMVQTVWNTLHGRIFEFTNPDGITIVSRLAFHSDFFLVLLTPIYALWQDPRLLLFIQALLLGLGSFFVYQLANLLLKNKTFSLVLAFLYLLNPSLERSVIYDFHAVTVATTFLLGSFYFMYTKRYGWFLLCALLAGLTKEHIWAIVALFGVYLALIQKRVKLGLGVVGVSALLFYGLIWYAIPNASGGAHFALRYYTESDVDSSSPTGLITTYLLSPQKAIEKISDPARVNYLIQQFSPLGFLPLLAPLYMIFSLPELGINILSARPQQYQIYYQYTAAITPFLFISTIFALKFLTKRFPRIPQTVFLAYLVSIGLYTAYLYGPLPGAKNPNLAMLTKPLVQKDLVDRLISEIPNEYSVSTSNSLGSHLAHRQYLFTLPYGWESADYIIFNLKDPNSYPSLETHKLQISKLTQDKRYIKYYDDGVFVAFRKNLLPAR